MLHNIPCQHDWHVHRTLDAKAVGSSPAQGAVVTGNACSATSSIEGAQ